MSSEARSSEARSSELRLIPNGCFTILSSKTGKHRTFRIKMANQSKVRWVSLLTGQNNTRDYKSFAVVSNDWTRIFVFHKYRATDRTQKPTLYETYACMLECMLTGKDDGYYEKMGYSISGSRGCARCGRELTQPESIRTGLGPECRRLREV